MLEISANLMLAQDGGTCAVVSCIGSHMTDSTCWAVASRHPLAGYERCGMPPVDKYWTAVCYIGKSNQRRYLSMDEDAFWANHEFRFHASYHVDRACPHLRLDECDPKPIPLQLNAMNVSGMAPCRECTTRTGVWSHTYIGTGFTKADTRYIKRRRI
jgi:hypothetical protein